MEVFRREATSDPASGNRPMDANILRWKLKALYDTYIAPTATLMVNLKSERQIEARAAVAPGGLVTATTLDRCQEEVFSIMARDNFPRFQKSNPALVAECALGSAPAPSIMSPGGVGGMGGMMGPSPTDRRMGGMGIMGGSFMSGMGGSGREGGGSSGRGRSRWRRGGPGCS